ncbi:MAG TPA: flagellar protein FliT [Candidatus Acidoferrales bacterium]|nr:flagellar protein FliT [Candidatus Acidoferrales bacterium]
MASIVSCLQPERQRMLDELDALSQSMLVCAQNGDWDGVTIAQPEFEIRLRRLCAGPIKAAEASSLTRGLLHLQQRICQLEDLTRSRCTELSHSLQRLHRQQDGAHIYQAVSGLVGGGDRR